jgi:hypothetical protein
LIRFDIVEGRTEQQIQTMLDAAHRAMLTAFKVPERDRYQIVTEHKSSRFIVQDTGLGIERTNNVVVVSVLSRPRSDEAKQAFYSELCRELKESCGIDAKDVMVSMIINSDVDWSFANGVAQFVTGEL